MKTCSNCGEEKPLSEFGKNKLKKDGHTYRCLVCQRAYARTHYENNKPAYMRASYAARDRSVARKREFLYNYYLDNPCVDCGVDDVRVLQSDHFRDKIHELSKLVNSGYSLQTMIEELEKCVTRCANCHQIRTAEQFGWWRTQHV